MQSTQIRQAFLDFFKSKQHAIVPSAPIVLKDDPTLMFTNAGMNQFKDYFLGNKAAKDVRVADTQKCLRVSGKHNDLEEVGVDTYHHTMFEMLGNWSFGDYFKQEAIDYAWEFLTEVLKLDKELLYATVFEGDAQDQLALDSEAKGYWSKHLPAERILNGDKKDNFWEMGATGPCGPCSEIHIDLRPSAERAKVDGASLVNQDHPQVVEIWNLVFMQYDRKADGSLVNLPAQHVDTGMGFERLVMAMQGKGSTYDTDVFANLIRSVEMVSNKQYGQSETTDIAIRVCVDHIRAIAFAIADGQLPSNTGAGYVIRRILRRAVRYGYTHLGLDEPFLHAMVAVLADYYGEAFPELTGQRDFIAKVIKEEETSFLRTLGAGIRKFGDIAEKLKASQSKEIDAQLAFELYDTYGFPFDLTRLMAQEQGFTIDESAFEAALNAQKERSKAAASSEQSDWNVVMEDDKEEFIGYDYLEADVRITRYREVKTKNKTFYQVVFNLTPFYAESGGQVGDVGYIVANGQKTSIKDTKKENDLIVHIVDKLPEDVHAVFKAVVNQGKRQASASNHSATHLLHAALREVLGDHVQQKGSLVAPGYLRFDFSHFSKMSDEELTRVEHMVNEKVRANIALQEDRAVPFQHALDNGAMALFGEKYGDVVRMITFDREFSVELCGGTHVQSTGEIGLFKITTETSVAAGVRRIEALTAQAANDFVDGQMAVLAEIGALVKNPKKTVQAVESLMSENAKLKKEIEQLNAQQSVAAKNELLNKVQAKNGVNYVGEIVPLNNGDAIKNLAFSMKQEVDNLFMVLGAEVNGKANLTIVINDALAKDKGWHAGNLVREWSKEIKGGGGGQPFYATAGGKDPSGLKKVLELAEAFVN